jgi:hypothetical protein
MAFLGRESRNTGLINLLKIPIKKSKSADEVSRAFRPNFESGLEF